MRFFAVAEEQAASLVPPPRCPRGKCREEYLVEYN
jgi:hypothetical protein